VLLTSLRSRSNFITEKKKKKTSVQPPKHRCVTVAYLRSKFRVRVGNRNTPVCWWLQRGTLFLHQIKHSTFKVPSFKLQSLFTLLLVPLLPYAKVTKGLRTILGTTGLLGSHSLLNMYHSERALFIRCKIGGRRSPSVPREIAMEASGPEA